MVFDLKLAYLQGVNSFLAFAFRNSAVGRKILCPCTTCVNSFWKEAGEVREHLICDGFLKGYKIWNLHGEARSFVNYGNYDGGEVVEESDEESDISDLLGDLAAGLDDRGDFDDNTHELVIVSSNLQCFQFLYYYIHGFNSHECVICCRSEKM
jgi:hypothetical protein